jgi:hypothetical protein
MGTPPPSPPSPAASPASPEERESDRQWRARLRGDAGPVTDAAAAREADALRLALQLERARAEQDPALSASLTEEEEERHWQRLQFRLRREGLADHFAEPKGGAGHRLRRLWLPASALAAAALAGLAVLVAVRVAEPVVYPEPDVLRGDAVIELRHTPAPPAGPRQAAEAFAAALRATGLKVALAQRGRTFYVDVALEGDQLETARPAFAAAGLPLPERAGLVRVAFERR